MAPKELKYPFMDSTHSDELAEFLRDFEFEINGFGQWQTERKTPVVEGYICDYQIAYVSQGALKFSTRGRDYLCTKGTLLLVEAFTDYTTQLDEQTEPLVCYSIHFDVGPEHRKREFFQYLLRAGGNVFTTDELPPMDGMFQDLYRCRTEKELGMILQVASHLRLACLYMLRARWPKDSVSVTYAKPTSAREVDIVKQSIQYMQEHVSTPLRVGDLSSHLNISENYLYKCFVDVMETPPSRYFLQYKIRLSVEMLTTTGLTVEGVAERLGFSSLYHFSKAFKQLMGCSPRNYINQIAGGKL